MHSLVIQKTLDTDYSFLQSSNSVKWLIAVNTLGRDGANSTTREPSNKYFTSNPLDIAN